MTGTAGGWNADGGSWVNVECIGVYRKRDIFLNTLACFDTCKGNPRSIKIDTIELN